MIFSGDFKKMLPVIRHANRATIVSKCFNRSYLWKELKKLNLTINMRLKVRDYTELNQRKEFAEYLLRIGNGTEPIITDLDGDYIKLPKELCIKEANVDEFFRSFVFNDLLNNYKNEDYFKNRAILCTKNKTVDFLNQTILNSIPEEEITYFSKNSSNIDETNSLYPIEYLNSYESNNLPNHQLNFKKHSVVMLLRNINTTASKQNINNRKK